MSHFDENCTKNLLTNEQINHEEEIFEKIKHLMEKSSDSITIKHEIQKLMKDKDREKIIAELIKLASKSKVRKRMNPTSD